jgi:membrane protein YdbS with pleckstrin-like domain
MRRKLLTVLKQNEIMLVLISIMLPCAFGIINYCFSNELLLQAGAVTSVIGVMLYFIFIYLEKYDARRPTKINS